MDEEIQKKLESDIKKLDLEEDQKILAFAKLSQMTNNEATEFLEALTEAVKIPDLGESIQLLEEFARYEGTELGELWHSLISLYYRRDYLGEDSALIPVLGAEIISQATWAKQNLEFVETTETYTKTHKVLREIQ